jgi:CheY-like chemotaxis protein
MSRKAKLLIVEDHDDTRALLVETLREQGYDVLESAHGREASQLAQRHSIDLIITDVLLPGKDGLEVILEVRKQQPQMRFLAISGGGRTIAADDCLHSAKAFGAQAVLKKPFQHQTFLNAVQSLLD